MTRAQAVKKLRRLVDDLTDANYHSEASFLCELADKLSEQEPVEMEDLIKWILKRDWTQ